MGFCTYACRRHKHRPKLQLYLQDRQHSQRHPWYQHDDDRQPCLHIRRSPVHPRKGEERDFCFLRYRNSRRAPATKVPITDLRRGLSGGPGVGAGGRGAKGNPCVSLGAKGGQVELPKDPMATRQDESASVQNQLPVLFDYL